jgi:hypothetical protein
MKQKTSFQPRSPTREGVVKPDVIPPLGDDIADWLQEVAKRPWVGGLQTVNPAVLPQSGPNSARVARMERQLQHGRELVALAVLALGYMQYYYLDTLVQIGGLPKVIVFVGPPRPTSDALKSETCEACQFATQVRQGIIWSQSA